MFTVDSASVDGTLLVLDVTPTHDLPQRLFQLAIMRELTFAACTT